MTEKKKMPHTLLIVLSILILFILLTWIVPPGQFERQVQNGREVVVPGTYHAVDPSPQGVMAFLTAPIRGMIALSTGEHRRQREGDAEGCLAEVERQPGATEAPGLRRLGKEAIVLHAAHVLGGSIVRRRCGWF